MTRNDSKLAFLRRAGWSDAHRTPLAGDASDRRYERLVMPEGRAVLMDAPPGRGDDPADVVQRLAAPVILKPGFERMQRAPHCLDLIQQERRIVAIPILCARRIFAT